MAGGSSGGRTALYWRSCGITGGHWRKNSAESLRFLFIPGRRVPPGYLFRFFEKSNGRKTEQNGEFSSISRTKIGKIRLNCKKIEKTRNYLDIFLISFYSVISWLYGRSIRLRRICIWVNIQQLLRDAAVNSRNKFWSALIVKNPLRRASSRKLRFRSALAAAAALCARNSMTAKGDAWQ